MEIKALNRTFRLVQTKPGKKSYKLYTGHTPASWDVFEGDKRVAELRGVEGGYAIYVNGQRIGKHNKRQWAVFSLADWLDNPPKLQRGAE